MEYCALYVLTLWFYPSQLYWEPWTHAKIASLTTCVIIAEELRIFLGSRNCLRSCKICHSRSHIAGVCEMYPPDTFHANFVVRLGALARPEGALLGSLFAMLAMEL